MSIKHLIDHENAGRINFGSIAAACVYLTKDGKEKHARVIGIGRTYVYLISGKRIPASRVLKIDY